MASILDDEKFQNLQLGLARALRTMRTESAALRKRQDDTEFEREKLSAKSDFERERLAKQEESKRLGVAARRCSYIQHHLFHAAVMACQFPDAR